MEFRRDGSARITVRRSKTDPEGEGAVQYIGPGASRALREIQPIGPGSGPEIAAWRGGPAPNGIVWGRQLSSTNSPDDRETGTGLTAVQMPGCQVGAAATASYRGKGGTWSGRFGGGWM